MDWSICTTVWKVTTWKWWGSKQIWKNKLALIFWLLPFHLYYSSNSEGRPGHMLLSVGENKSGVKSKRQTLHQVESILKRNGRTKDLEGSNKILCINECANTRKIISSNQYDSERAPNPRNLHWRENGDNIKRFQLRSYVRPDS